MSQPGDIHKRFTLALIALGGNATSLVGNPNFTLREALKRLNGDSVRVNKTSRFFSTPAFPAGSGPDFVNAAAVLETSMNARDLLQVLHGVELAFGRDRKVRWAERTLDLDLIAFGDEIAPNLETFKRWHDLDLDAQQQEAPDGLILPHPRLQDRSFVLVPLADVAPDWRHPVLGRTVTEMLEARPEAEKAEIQPL